MLANIDERGSGPKRQSARSHAAEHESGEARAQSEASAPGAQDLKQTGQPAQGDKARPHKRDREHEQAVHHAEIDKLQGEIKTLQDKYLRAIADFDNYRKRVARENEERTRCATEDLILRLLEVIDNMERAFDAAEGTKDWEGLKKGLELTYGHLKDILAKEGLCPIKCIGERFDPNLHEAVRAMEKEGAESENVIEEVQKGYTLGGKVIRPSKVVVSK